MAKIMSNEFRKQPRKMSPEELTNTTAITTSVTDARTAIINNDNANALTLNNNNLTTAKNTIIANDNTNTTNIVNNDNANKTAIITNDNTNTTNIVNNSNANTLALNDLILRSQIEADPATESNGVKVAWYMTPTANGGKLDLVKQIVTLTLANIQGGRQHRQRAVVSRPRQRRQSRRKL